MFPGRQEVSVGFEVSLGHPPGGEAFFEGPAAVGSCDGIDGSHGGDRLFHVVDNKTVHSIHDDFRDRSPAEGDDRRAAGHGLDHDQPERFRPVYGEEEGSGLAQKAVFLPLVDFADELDSRLVQERPYSFVEKWFVHRVHFGGDLELHAQGKGNFDCGVHPLLRGDAAEEGQVTARFGVKAQQLVGNAVVHRALPVDVRQGATLRIGYGNERHLGEFGVEKLQIVDVLPAVQGGYMGCPPDPGQGKMDIVQMKVDDVVEMSFIEDAVDHQQVMHQIVPRDPAEPERPVANRLQGGAGQGIAAGVKGDVVSEPDKFFGEIGDNPFRAAVQLRGDALDQWSNLCNSHMVSSAE